jgi:RNA polymerase sigma-70 factor (ECF subfamily)
MKTMEEHVSVSHLVSLAQAGDREAFEELVALYGERLEALIRSRLGTHLAGEAEIEDVHQETLLRAFRTIGRFQWHGGDSFVRWLGSIAEHVIRDLARRQRRKPEVHLEQDGPASTASPSRMYRRKERFVRLNDALQALRPDYRQVILLARVEGLPLAEVATRMNRSVNAVAILLLRALRQLGEIFGETESFHLPNESMVEGGDGDDR